MSPLRVGCSIEGEFSLIYEMPPSVSDLAWMGMAAVGSMAISGKMDSDSFAATLTFELECTRTYLQYVSTKYGLVSENYHMIPRHYLQPTNGAEDP